MNEREYAVIFKLLTGNVTNAVIVKAEGVNKAISKAREQFLNQYPQSTELHFYKIYGEI